MADQIDELLGAATRALRDLDRRALLDLAQHERDPLIVGQRVERQRQAVGQLPPLGHRVGRRRLSAAHPLDLGQALRRPPTPRRRAHVAPRAVGRHADHEAAQRRRAAEVRDRVGQRQERVVDDVLGRRVVAEQPARERPHRRVVRGVRLGDRGALALAQARDQVRITRRGDVYDRQGQAQLRAGHRGLRP